MKQLSNLLKFVGAMFIIGTAGASDCMLIDFPQMMTQIGYGILIIVGASLLPSVGRVTAKIVTAIFM